VFPAPALGVQVLEVSYCRTMSKGFGGVVRSGHVRFVSRSSCPGCVWAAARSRGALREFKGRASGRLCSPARGHLLTPVSMTAAEDLIHF